MIKRNCWTNVKKPLEIHNDDRGIITDLFYNENINHVAIINSKPNVIRGNHYHKKTTQHILITEGSLDYWYKPLNSKEKSQFINLRKGDIVSTSPNEIHALVIKNHFNQFIVFSSGLRGGKDYESDTYRVKSIINEK